MYKNKSDETICYLNRIDETIIYKEKQEWICFAVMLIINPSINNTINWFSATTTYLWLWGIQLWKIYLLYQQNSGIQDTIFQLYLSFHFVFMQKICIPDTIFYFLSLRNKVC